MTSPSSEMLSPDQPSIEELFRGAMRRLASGVVLVTTCGADGQPYGIAMTAIMSLSMDPPSMLLAVNRTASLCEPLLASGEFSINIMAWDDAEACQSFVSAPAAERFATMDWNMGERGLPLLTSSVANILCSIDKAEPFGSHMVIRGLVQKVVLGEDRNPLLYVAGRYGQAAQND